MKKVTILKYSEKSIVVTGNTKPIKNQLKMAGGAWNARLSNPTTGERMMGWIFAKHRQDKVRLLCEKAHKQRLIGVVDVPIMQLS